MSEKEADVYLNSDDLLTAISQYLARKKIRIQPGTSFQWLITPEAGYELPPIKDISLGIVFRDTDE